MEILVKKNICDIIQVEADDYIHYVSVISGLARISRGNYRNTSLGKSFFFIEVATIFIMVLIWHGLRSVLEAIRVDFLRLNLRRQPKTMDSSVAYSDVTKRLLCGIQLIPVDSPIMTLWYKTLDFLGIERIKSKLGEKARRCDDLDDDLYL